MTHDLESSSDERRQASPVPKLVLRLYITRGAANSVCALANLKTICERHYAERYEVEVIDILTHPKRAFADGILLTPTLVKLAPLPQARIVGDLSQTERVLLALGPLSGG
jgi:circadian clock protein KaiB